MAEALAKLIASRYANRNLPIAVVLPDGARVPLSQKPEVDVTADVADIARLFVDDGLRSVPVLDDGRLAGIVSRRDLLRALVRPDTEIRTDVLRLVEGYTGDLGAWEITVSEGMTTIRRTHGAPQVSRDVEDRALRALAGTVAGVIGVRVLSDSVPPGPGPTVRPVDTSV
jgi:CBS domain-containing protein